MHLVFRMCICYWKDTLNTGRNAQMHVSKKKTVVMLEKALLKSLREKQLQQT